MSRGRRRGHGPASPKLRPWRRQPSCGREERGEGRGTCSSRAPTNDEGDGLAAAVESVPGPRKGGRTSHDSPTPPLSPQRGPVSSSVTAERRGSRGEWEAGSGRFPAAGRDAVSARRPARAGAKPRAVRRPRRDHEGGCAKQPIRCRRNSLSLEDAAAQDLHGQRDVVPGFAVSQDGPTLLLAANAAGGCKLKPMSLTIQKTLGPHESC